MEKNYADFQKSIMVKLRSEENSTKNCENSYNYNNNILRNTYAMTNSKTRQFGEIAEKLIFAGFKTRDLMFAK